MSREEFAAALQSHGSAMTAFAQAMSISVRRVGGRVCGAALRLTRIGWCSASLRAIFTRSPVALQSLIKTIYLRRGRLSRRQRAGKTS